MMRFLVALAVIAALLAGYLFAALSWSYSSGERAGWVQKLSHKGWLCKTWEGELALVSLPGSTVEKFAFTVRDAGVAQEMTQVTMYSDFNRFKKFPSNPKGAKRQLR